MIKIVAVKYPTSTDRVKNTTVNLTSVHQCEDVNAKQLFNQLLFDTNIYARYNYCLTKFNNKLYLIDPLNTATNEYARRTIEYHPLQHLLD